MRRIEVLVDDVKKQEWEQSCATDSCPMERSYALKLNNLDAGKHILKVVATDYVGKKREREIEFEFIPATGMKDEYVMHYFPLPGGEGNEAEEENPQRPELAVNVVNGNLVYREKDVDVEGYGVDLEVERYYNSLLPEEENTEWGDGWTLAQTPDFEPEQTQGQGPPAEALMVRSSGAVEGSVELPASVGTTKFDPELQAVVTKEPEGAYQVADATGETDTATLFDSQGEVEELRTEGPATLDYAYEEGELSEIEVDDPASTGFTIEEAEEWDAARNTPAFVDSFGSTGSAPGQFITAGDIGQTSSGDFWVLDVYNHRIQKLNEEGEQLDVITQGGEGKTLVPNGLTVDAEDHIWITDSSRHVVEEFDAQGDFVRRFGGGWGTAPGQFRHPQGLAIDPQGDVLVTDMLNGRLQEFTPTGELIRVVGSEGSGPGQLDGPGDVTVASDGTIWVADIEGHDVEVLEQDGDFIRSWGSYGSGEGQFAAPVAIALGAKGQIWVSDMGNGRVQQFDSEGNFVRSFGEKGTGDGQFDFGWPNGILADEEGNLWVTDGSNDRVQWWRLGRTSVPGNGPAPEEDDPAVEVEVSGDLVDSVEGEEAGLHLYAHEGDLLTAHADADGATQYSYDANDRMTKVTLPNGTYAEIEYGATDGRVKSVSVDPAGAEPKKTTTFSYKDQPRETTVNLPDTPAIKYQIGEDGSVFKSQNVLKAPEFEDIAGTLYDFRETANPINVGDYNLSVKAYSEEGIASIQVYANGNQLISEKTCPEVETEPEKCKHLPDEWVTYTGDHPPGILTLEILIEDRFGNISAERFWVNIPYTSPPAPDQPKRPRFAEVLQFREEHGLDIDLDPVQGEEELNNRVFDTINDWVQGNPVAEASMERWGAPLRAPEVAELEYRIAYWRQASEVIPDWAALNTPTTFAGFYLDERAGGKVVAGFVGEQAASSLAELEQSAGLVVEPERVVAFSTPPKYTLTSLESLLTQVSEAAKSYPTGLISSTGIDVKSNSVRVGATNVSQAQTLLQGNFGAQAPILVTYQPDRRELKTGRERIGGMVRAGDEIIQRYLFSSESGPCTAGFGAFERSKKPGTGESVLRLFALSAGHCGEIDAAVKRRSNPEPTEEEKQEIGKVKRNGLLTPGDSAIDVDAMAIRLDTPAFVPRQIFQAEGMPLIDVTSAWSPTVGTNLCFSGRTSKNILRCGPVLGPPKVEFWGDGSALLEMCFKEYIWGGDSGSPVWVEGTGVAVGIAISGYGGPDEPGLTLEEKAEEEEAPEEACAALLLPYQGRPSAGSIFGSPDLAPLHLVTKTNAKP